MKRFAGMMLVGFGMALTAQMATAQEWSQPWARENREITAS